MRDLFAKVMTGSMVAGAALLVAACGGGGDNTANNTANATADETLMGNDVTTVDATNAGTANLGAATDMNSGAAMTTTTTNTTDTTTNTGAGTGNTTGM
jgi:hypothetical protein